MRHFLTSLYFLCAIILFIFIANTAAQFFWLYAKFTWLDATLHYFAGLWLGCAFLRWAYQRPEFSLITKKWWMIILITVSVVALIGVLWEVYELEVDVLFGNTMSMWKQANGLEDTISDLLFDMFGAFVAVFLSTFFTKKDIEVRSV